MTKLMLKKPATTTVPVVELDRKYLNKAIDAYAKALALHTEAAAKVKEITDALPDLKLLKEDLLNLLPDYYPDEVADADLVFTIESNQHQFEVGKQGTKREVVNKEFVFNKLKKGQFIQIATLPLGELDKYLTPEEQENCIQKHRTDRNLKYTGAPEKKKLK